VTVPLSDDEERILSQIERKYHEHDPKSARRLQQTTLPRYLRRNVAWGLVGFVLGLAILLVAFASSWVVGIVGFVVMTVSAIVVVQNLRRMGRHGLRLLSDELGERGVGDRLSETTERWRRRFRDD
jgi:predicted histidine transporter YuiF (NhaC family)